MPRVVLQDRRFLQNRWLMLGLVSVMLTTVSLAQETPEFSRDVAPIFKKYCAGCHNDADKEGEFSLESFASLQKGTDDGPAVLPGDVAGSRLIRAVMGTSEPRMPPEGEPAPSAAQVEVLKQWVEAGAKGPDGQEPDRLHLIVPHVESQTDRRPISAIAAAPGGVSLAVARFGRVEILREQRITGPNGRRRREMQPVQTLTDFPGKVTAVHFRGGARLMTASGVTGLGGVATLWEWPLNRKIVEFKGHLDIMLDAEISPDGSVVATCSYDKLIILWNAATGEKLRTLEGHTGPVYAVAFSPDGKFLASASADDTCKVWRVSDGERMDTLGQPLKEQYAIQFSPDGKSIIAGGADNRIRVWSFVSTDKPRINPLLQARFAHEGAIVALQFTPDGARLISVADDRSIKVWDAKAWQELQLLENEPEVAMALAVVNDANFVVGRLDGTLGQHAIRPNEQAQTADRPQLPAAPAALSASPLMSGAEVEPNNLVNEAQFISAPSQISGAIQGQENGQADRDHFKFTARAGEEWVIEVNAAREKSRLDSFVEVLDHDGQRMERVLLQAVRDSYYTFRGKDADQVGDFRIFNWEEMELNQYLYSGGEVVKLWLSPRGPDSGFSVYPGQGKRWGYFDTTPLAHALGEPCYIVNPYPPGTELVPNGLPVFTLYYENDDDAHRELTADSRLSFTAPRDGDYMIRLRDVRGLSGEDFKYTLTLRPRQPDFQVSLPDKVLKINAGSSREFKVSIKRIDDFDGPVQIDIENLPMGFSVTTPIIVEAGQIEALGVLSAKADAEAPGAEAANGMTVTASARIRGSDVVHPALNLGEIKLEKPPQITATIVAAPNGAQPLASENGSPLEFEIHPGETIMLKVVVHRGEFKDIVRFGNEDSGRNLPHGVIVDNIGLNGLMLLEDQSEREFFITAAKWVPAQSRLFHLRTLEAEAQATAPVILHVRDPRGAPVATAASAEIP